MPSSGDISTMAVWLAPPASPRTAPAEVHIWLASLTATPGSLRSCWEILDENERARALAFRFPRPRERFVIARGILRQILGRYFRQPPASLRLATEAHGKPFLADNVLDLRFNIAHSEDLALVAVSQAREVGVDVERVREHLEVEAIARHSFSRVEVDALLKLPPPLRGGAFFACWTLKEAYLKARGDGLTLPLDAFAVSVGTPGPARLLDVRGTPEEAPRWSLRTLPLDGPYRAAVAVEGHDWSLRRWRWTS